MHKSVPEWTEDRTGGLTIPARTLRPALTSVADFVSENDTRPSLGCLWLAVRKTRVHAVAMNPYCLAIDSVEFASDSTEPGAGKAFDAPIPLDILQAFIRDTSASKATDSAHFHFSETLFGSVSYTVTKSGRAHRVERTWSTSGLVLPNYHGIIPKGEPVPVGKIALNPRFLELCARNESWAGLTFYGEFTAALVTGATFFGLIMPLRIDLRTP
jgi:hypothetical protein